MCSFSSSTRMKAKVRGWRSDIWTSPPGVRERLRPGEFLELLPEAGAPGEAQAARGVHGDVDAVDRREHAPAEPRVHRRVPWEVARDDRGGVADQLGAIPRRERGRRRDDERL